MIKCKLNKMPVNKLDHTHSRATEMVKDLKFISLEEYLKACEWLIWTKKKPELAATICTFSKFSHN